MALANGFGFAADGGNRFTENAGELFALVEKFTDAIDGKQFCDGDETEPAAGLDEFLETKAVMGAVAR